MIKSPSLNWQSLRILNVVTGICKYILFSSILMLFIVHHSIVCLILVNEKRKLRYFMWSISRTSSLALKVLNIKVSVVGPRGEVQKKLIVANHLSYLDVLILFSYFPSLFVTSTEIRDTFLLGRVCKLAGCFFVERRKELRKDDTKNLELKCMKKQFENGFNVFLFPEGTSSDGLTVLPFKSTFFQLAVDTQTPVQPICIQYLGLSRNLPPWFGDMTFPDHLFRLCCEKQIEAKLTILSEISATDRFELSNSCYEIIKDCYDKG